MSTDAAAGRRLVHNRQILCQGFERDDGLWEIEATLIDTKTHEVALLERALIRANEPIHQISMTLVVDRALLIHAAKVRFSHSPYQECCHIQNSYAQLAGMHIGPGFIKKVKHLFRGSAGCTHATELIGPAASAAYQTLWNQVGNDGTFDASKELPKFAVGGCHALREDGPVVRRFTSK